ALEPAVNPPGEYTLRGLAKLPCTRHDSTAVYPNRKAVRSRVFECELLRCEFACSVQSRGRTNRVALRDSRPSKATLGRTVCEPEAIGACNKRNTAQCGQRVHPTGTQKDQSRAVTAAVFERIDGAEKILLKKLPRRSFSIDSRQYRCVCGCVDHPIRRGNAVKITFTPDIAMHYADPRGAKARAIHFASGS